MIGMAASALVLQCFFNAAPDGSAPNGTIPVVTMPVPDQFATSLQAKDPPQSRNAFVGEPGPAKEWTFGNSRDPSASQIKLLRVSLAEGILPPSPYQARYGTATKQADGAYTFATEMTGMCKLKSAGEMPEGNNK